MNNNIIKNNKYTNNIKVKKEIIRHLNSYIYKRD